MLEKFHLHQTGWNDLLSQAVHPTISGGIPGVFQLNDEGIHNACLYV
jgi:hypothetical protein